MRRWGNIQGEATLEAPVMTPDAATLGVLVVVHMRREAGALVIAVAMVAGAEGLFGFLEIKLWILLRCASWLKFCSLQHISKR